MSKWSMLLINHWFMFSVRPSMDADDARGRLLSTREGSRVLNNFPRHMHPQLASNFVKISFHFRA